MVNALISQNQSALMKARWANPVFAEKQAGLFRKPAHCPTCGEEDIAKFYLNAKGLRSNKKCKECFKASNKARWHSLTWIDRLARKSRQYGVTKDFLVDLYNKQGGKCAICGEIPQTERGLHIDHCHQTGAIRGFLCHGCNTGIGAMKDSVDIVSKALSYLKG